MFVERRQLGCGRPQRPATPAGPPRRTRETPRPRWHSTSRAPGAPASAATHSISSAVAQGAGPGPGHGLCGRHQRCDVRRGRCAGRCDARQPPAGRAERRQFPIRRPVGGRGDQLLDPGEGAEPLAAGRGPDERHQPVPVRRGLLESALPPARPSVGSRRLTTWDGSRGHGGHRVGDVDGVLILGSAGPRRARRSGRCRRARTQCVRPASREAIGALAQRKRLVQCGSRQLRRPPVAERAEIGGAVVA